MCPDRLREAHNRGKEDYLVDKQIQKSVLPLLVKESIAVGVAHRVNEATVWTLLDVVVDNVLPDADSMPFPATFARLNQFKINVVVIVEGLVAFVSRRYLAVISFRLQVNRVGF